MARDPLCALHHVLELVVTRCDAMDDPQAALSAAIRYLAHRGDLTVQVHRVEDGPAVAARGILHALDVAVEKLIAEARPDEDVPF